MGQKDGEKWTAAVDSQPMLPKPDRLLGPASRPMPELEIDPALLGFAVAALLYAALAARLFFTAGALRGDLQPPRAFLAAVATSAAWAVGSAAAAAAFDTAWLPPTVALLDVGRYGLWFLFLLLLIAPASRPRATGETRLLVPVAALVVAGTALTLLLPVVELGSTASERVSQFGALALPLLGLILIEQLFRNLPEDSRWNAKPLCLGLGAMFAFDLYISSEAVLFGSFDRDAVAIRGAVHALAVPLLFVASHRHANWIGKLKVSRNAAFYSATLLLAGLYLLFISAIGYYVRYFGGSWGRALQLALLVVAAVVLTLLVFSGSMRARLRVFVGKNFFSYRYDYREEWLRFTAMLSASPSPQEMGALVVRGLANLVESPGGSLWSKALDDDRFAQSARWNMPVIDDRVAVDSALAQFLLERNWIVDIDEFRHHPERHEGLELPAGLAGAEAAWVVVPLIVGDAMTGFVVLVRPRTPVELNWEVRDLLKTASRQAASFLSQMQATEALLEARKFEAFNRMSAFVVHDLKNIVTQLTLMMRNAKRLHDNPEFRQDMLITVESSLEKMRQLMLQLREGEKPPGGTSGVDLAAIAQRIGAVAAQRDRQLEIEIQDRVATRGHEERIERVLGHVVQNAFDATPAEGRVWLRLSRVGGLARVEVGDTGQGMTREFIERELFRPFRSTKQGGMGIGSYESWQYVRELGGTLAVDSEPGRGSLITIDLPLLQTRQTAGSEFADTA